MKKTMKINIWSDVRCPFCYIGKRKFEKALALFSKKDEIEVIWRSFELDPDLETRPGENTVEHIARVKGISSKQAEQMHEQVTEIARKVGLDFDFENAVVANSFNAHRLIQLAKLHGLGNAIEEELFKAHFTRGENIDDGNVLLRLGLTVGIPEKEVRDMLSGDGFSQAVKQDEQEAYSIGVSGVPFFVFDNKYAVSGAQSPEVFLQALQQSWNNFEQRPEMIPVEEGPSCSPEGDCR